MWYQSLVALDLGFNKVFLSCDNDGSSRLLPRDQQASRNSRIHELATTLLQKKFYLLYGSAGGRVITAAGGRSYNENNRCDIRAANLMGCLLREVVEYKDNTYAEGLGFMVPAGLLMVSSACLVRYCFVIAAGL
ncbi:hypothetical protein Tco_0695964 [Tanacetum coccineum]